MKSPTASDWSIQSARWAAFCSTGRTRSPRNTLGWRSDKLKGSMVRGKHLLHCCREGMESARYCRSQLRIQCKSANTEVRCWRILIVENGLSCFPAYRLRQLQLKISFLLTNREGWRAHWQNSSCRQDQRIKLSIEQARCQFLFQKFPQGCLLSASSADKDLTYSNWFLRSHFHQHLIL